MVYVEIIGTAASIIAAVYGFLAYRESLSNEREARISEVVQNYVSIFRNINSIDGFMQAGAADLNDDSEVREASERIYKRVHHYPLGGLKPENQTIDLKEFLNYLLASHWNFSAGKDINLAITDMNKSRGKIER